MARKLTLRDCILTILQSAPNCELEQLAYACAGYTWEEVFLEVDRLSRSGQVRIEHPNISEYKIVLIPPANSTATEGNPDWSAR